MTLAEEVEFNEQVVPACLSNSTYQEFIGELLTVSGWGERLTAEPTYNEPNKLHVVQVPYITDEVCRGNETEYDLSRLTDNMFCAGNITHGSIDSCWGDSGGMM